MIVEVRTYTTKPGCRQRFLDLFQTRTRPLQVALGMGILGPWVDKEHPDRFVWMRTFPSMDARERMKRALYEGAEWTGELEAIAMALLEEYSSILAEIDDGAIARLEAHNLRETT